MKHIALLLVLCLLLTGCAVAQVAEDAPETKETVAETTTDTTAADTGVEDTTAATDPTEAARVVSPLPDATMENLTDAILSISLEEGGAYVDDTGKMQMDLKIYSYDKYDMVDIANLKVGDVIEINFGQRTAHGVNRAGGVGVAVIIRQYECYIFDGVVFHAQIEPVEETARHTGAAGVAQTADCLHLVFLIAADINRHKTAERKLLDRIQSDLGAEIADIIVIIIFVEVNIPIVFHREPLMHS